MKLVLHYEVDKCRVDALLLINNSTTMANENQDRRGGSQEGNRDNREGDKARHQGDNRGDNQGDSSKSSESGSGNR